MTKVDRIGIFGGSFNPIHNGHLAAVKCFQKQLKLDRVILVPTGKSFYKDEPTASFEDRFRMCELAVEGIPDVEVSDIERSYPEGMYTCDMLDVMRAKFPSAQLVFLVGSDVFESVCRWKNSRKIAQTVDFGVIGRFEEDRQDIRRRMLTMTAGFLRLYGAKTAFVEGVKPLSSTQVRRAIATGVSVDELLPDTVDSYVKRKGLYVVGKPGMRPFRSTLKFYIRALT